MTDLGIGVGPCYSSSVSVMDNAEVRIRSGGTVPMATALIPGQRLGNLPAEWFDPDNYSAPGTISVALLINGTARGSNWQFQDGDTVALNVFDDEDSNPLFLMIDYFVSVGYTAPTLTGELTDQTYIVGSSSATYDASVGFIGSELTYSLTTAPDGTIIDPDTGIIDLSGASVGTSGTVMVRAQTPDAQIAEDHFFLDVVEAGGAGEITAILTPAISALYEGQTLAEMADYATMTSPANFVTSSGAIDTVTVTFQGNASNAATPLYETETAGFTITVKDTTGSSTTFVAAPKTVEYKARIATTPDNRAQIEINSIVPDSETVDLTISGTAEYDGTYSDLSVAAIRHTIYNIPGTIDLTHSGAQADLGAGDAVTASLGLWTSPSGAVVLNTELRANGAAIAGANIAEEQDSYILTSAEEGTQLTLHVIGSDGINPSVIAEGPAGGINVPGGTTTPAVMTATGVGATSTMDLSAFGADDHVMIFGHVWSSSSSGSIAAVLVDGVRVTPAIASLESQGKNKTAAFRFQRPADVSAPTSLTFEMAGTATAAHHLLRAYNIGGLDIAERAKTSAASTKSSVTSHSVSLDVLPGDQILAMVCDSGSAGPDLIVSGVTESTADQMNLSTRGNLNAIGSAQITTLETRTISVTGDGSQAAFGLVAVALV